MTPDQYRREGFRAGIEAAAIEAENCGTCDQCGDCFVAADAIRAIDVYKVMAGLPTVAVIGGHSVVEVCPICDIAGCRHIRDAASAPDPVARLVEAARALGAMPEGYCFCSTDRGGDDSKTHEPECADLRAALAKMENEQCQVSIEPATGAAMYGPRGSDADAHAAVANSHPDAVARLMEAARQRDGGSHDQDCRINRANSPFCDCGHDDLMSALTAIEKDQ